MTAACVSALAIAILYRLAGTWGLVDRPNERKHHVGHIPLIGGLAAFVGVLAGAAVDGQTHLFTNVLLATAAVLAVVGALDDRFDLSVRARLLVQTGAVLTMVAVTGVHIHTLGHLFGHEFELGVFGIPLTVVAVIGLLNAFNMMDGIDGLAGMLALISIAAIILYQGQPQWPGVVVLVLLAGALVPYLAANLGLVGKKIFLGDAGSMVVGYVLAWTLIHLSQSGPNTELSTIDVLWCVALPVLDTLQVVVRRVREGKSPFKPDRGHIHHMMLRAGLGPRTTLAALVMLAILLALTGMLTHSLAPGSNLIAFGALTVIYVTAMGRLWQKQQSAPSLQPRPTFEAAALPSNVVRLQSPVTMLSSYSKRPKSSERGSAAN
ncbi:MraY family glycosyltransferase [Frateuria soli]|uniref:MraY family glycosyltransferase n=1 Tax=Frateuria soli TaxID=1542730 RepID=UPI001E35A33B|nr:MraY family glycosyltransferase [Frateuria soli]UGB38533.1 undecaprenyl/decaprenyl-phosphate alpha-N-acetylglucosaminyl 1-phosphate transferase [Frateuria soli]